MTCDACGNPATSYRSKLRSLREAAAEADAIGYAHGASAVLRELAGVLYPDGPDTEWTPDTLDAVAGILTRHGVAP